MWVAHCSHRRGGTQTPKQARPSTQTVCQNDSSIHLALCFKYIEDHPLAGFAGFVVAVAGF